MWFLVTLHLILLHAPGGGEIHINIDEISSIREVSESDEKLLHEHAHCMLGMSNGKFIAVNEDCKQVILELAKYDSMEKQK